MLWNRNKCEGKYFVVGHFSDYETVFIHLKYWAHSMQELIFKRNLFTGKKKVSFLQILKRDFQNVVWVVWPSMKLHRMLKILCLFVSFLSPNTYRYLKACSQLLESYLLYLKKYNMCCCSLPNSSQDFRLFFFFFFALQKGMVKRADGFSLFQELVVGNSGHIWATPQSDNSHTVSHCVCGGMEGDGARQRQGDSIFLSFWHEAVRLTWKRWK